MCRYIVGSDCNPKTITMTQVFLVLVAIAGKCCNTSPGKKCTISILAAVGFDGAMRQCVMNHAPTLGQKGEHSPADGSTCQDRPRPPKTENALR